MEKVERLQMDGQTIVGTFTKNTPTVAMTITPLEFSAKAVKFQDNPSKWLAFSLMKGQIIRMQTAQQVSVPQWWYDKEIGQSLQQPAPVQQTIQQTQPYQDPFASQQQSIPPIPNRRQFQQPQQPVYQPPPPQTTPQPQYEMGSINTSDQLLTTIIDRVNRLFVEVLGIKQRVNDLWTWNHPPLQAPDGSEITMKHNVSNPNNPAPSATPVSSTPNGRELPEFKF